MPIARADISQDLLLGPGGILLDLLNGAIQPDQAFDQLLDSSCVVGRNVNLFGMGDSGTYSAGTAVPLGMDFSTGINPADYEELTHVQTVNDGSGNVVAEAFEGSPAVMRRQIDFPANAGKLTFDYHFVNKGDGDSLQLSLNNNVVWSLVGTSDTSTALVHAPKIDVSALAGQTVDVEFRLNSVNQPNVRVWLDNVNIAPIIPPSISSFSVTPSFTRAQTMTLDAQAGDTDGRVTAVQFYFDKNANGVIDGADTLLGTGSSSAGHWKWTHAAPTSLPLGAIHVLSRARDDDGAWSDPMSAAATVIARLPKIVKLTDAPDPVTTKSYLKLTATTSAADSRIMRVQFFWDKDNNGKLDVKKDKLLYTDTSAAGGWTCKFLASFLRTGSNRFFARALDNLGVWSAPLSTVTKVSGATRARPAYLFSTAPIAAAPSPPLFGAASSSTRRLMNQIDTSANASIIA